MFGNFGRSIIYELVTWRYPGVACDLAQFVFNSDWQIVYYMLFE